MKYRLIIRGDFQKKLKKYFYPDKNYSLERFAVVFLAPGKSRGMRTLITAELLIPDDNDYEGHSNTALKLKDQFVGRYWQYCKKNRYFPMTIHSHPFEKGRFNFFSSIDDSSDKDQLRFFGPMIPNGFFVTGVMNRSGVLTYRLFETRYPDHPERLFDEVLYCDFPIKKEFPSKKVMPKKNLHDDNDIYDRQIRAFGREGQELMGRLRVCLAGAGGLGSVLAEILVRLGVKDFILIDDDIAESTNLNRFTGMYQNDVEQKRTKVKIVRRLIKRINPSAKVRCIHTEIYASKAVDALKQADIIFLSTDNVTSRDFVNKFSVQYLTPCISIGTVIEYNKKLEKITAILGEVVLMIPGSSKEKFCLICSGTLNTDLLKLENAPGNLTERLRGYIRGDEEPAPAVRYLNGLAANLAAAEFHNLVCAFKEPAFCQQINLMPRTIFFDDFFEDDLVKFLEYLKDEKIIASDDNKLKVALMDNFTIFDEKTNRRRLLHRIDNKIFEDTADRFVQDETIVQEKRALFVKEIRDYLTPEPAISESVINSIDVRQQEDNCRICGPMAFRMAYGDIAELKKVSF